MVLVIGFDFSEEGGDDWILTPNDLRPDFRANAHSLG